MSWRKVKLGDVIKHRKGFITIENDNEYKLCRVQVHRKGVVLRGIVKGTEIKTKKQQVCKAGDFLVAEMDAKVGGYGFVPNELDGAIVSSHYFLFELDEKKIRPKFLEVVSQLRILQDQIKAVGSTNYAAIRPANVLNWEIPITTIEEQKKIEKLFDILKSKGIGLSTELTHQQNLLKQLRQAFLREAMHGKLLAKANEEFEINVPPDKSGGNSPGSNSKNQLPLALASGQKEKQAKGFSQTGKELLEQIKKEKEKLITAGKLKKEKPLPPIKEGEVPFDIPENWMWCRLGEIGKITGGGTPSMANDSYWNGNIPWVSPKDMGEDFVYDTEMKVTKKGVAESSANLIPEGSLLIVGRSGILKRKLPVAINKIECTVNQDMKVIIPYIGSMNRFLQLMLFGLEKIVLKDFVKFGMTVHSLKYEEFAQMPIPLPPLAEQKRIVKKLAELMNLCEELKTTITDNQNYTDQLLQVALKEALHLPAGKAGMKEIEPV